MNCHRPISAHGRARARVVGRLDHGRWGSRARSRRGAGKAGGRRWSARAARVPRPRRGGRRWRCRYRSRRRGRGRLARAGAKPTPTEAGQTRARRLVDKPDSAHGRCSMWQPCNTSSIEGTEASTQLSGAQGDFRAAPRSARVRLAHGPCCDPGWQGRVAAGYNPGTVSSTSSRRGHLCPVWAN